MQHAISVLILAVALLSGCATAPPVQEMSDARQALQAAKEANAERQAPDTYRDAKRFMERAAQKLEQGEYEQARRAAVVAKERAVQARDEATANP